MQERLKNTWLEVFSKVAEITPTTTAGGDPMIKYTTLLRRDVLKPRAQHNISRSERPYSVHKGGSVEQKTCI